MSQRIPVIKGHSGIHFLIMLQPQIHEKNVFWTRRGLCRRGVGWGQSRGAGSPSQVGRRHLWGYFLSWCLRTCRKLVAATHMDELERAKAGVLSRPLPSCGLHPAAGGSCFCNKHGRCQGAAPWPRPRPGWPPSAPAPAAGGPRGCQEGRLLTGRRAAPSG